MKTIGIRELQKNPSAITKWLENREYTLITKRNRPIGIAIAFDDAIITRGLRTSLLLQAYQDSLLSLGELAKALGMSKEEVMKFLSVMGVDVIDYDFYEDLATIKEIVK